MAKKKGKKTRHVVDKGREQSGSLLRYLLFSFIVCVWWHRLPQVARQTTSPTPPQFYCIAFIVLNIISAINAVIRMEQRTEAGSDERLSDSSSSSRDYCSCAGEGENPKS